MTSLITIRDVARPVHRARWSRDGPWGHAHITTSWHGGPLSLLQILAAVHSDMSLCALLLDTDEAFRQRPVPWRAVVAPRHGLCPPGICICI